MKYIFVWQILTYNFSNRNITGDNEMKVSELFVASLTINSKEW